MLRRRVPLAVTLAVSLGLHRDRCSFRAALSEQADPHRRAVPAGRADRRRRAPDRRSAVGAVRADHRGREPSRRRRRHGRREVGGVGRSRRLHHPVHAAGSAGDGARDLQERRLRSGESVRAGGGGVLLAADPRGQSERAGEVDAGARRAREGQSRQGQLCVARLQHAAASARRDAQADDRRRHRARAVQGLGAGAHRSDRRPGADVFRRRVVPAAACRRAGSSACSRSPTKAACRSFPIRRPRSRPDSASCRRATGSACWCRRARRRAIVDAPQRARSTR